MPGHFDFTPERVYINDHSLVKNMRMFQHLAGNAQRCGIMARGRFFGGGCAVNV
jgi:hypothetical protein